jgi:hypothetical protein
VYGARRFFWLNYGGAMKKFAVMFGFVALLGAVGSVRVHSNDRCTLLTQAEATVALAAPVGPGGSLSRDAGGDKLAATALFMCR